ncbi:hypothetical protein DH2020_037991 [Rehmannia glutinosa]|uniref:Uncharacterized protein n=1 Tax=Rehmannia glutinosa TaxID=99300 RepID=A0ABR0V112_REHGL
MPYFCMTFDGCILGLVGKVDFTVRHLSSSTVSFPASWDFSSGQQCIGSGARHLKKTWTICFLVLTKFTFLHFHALHILPLLHMRQHGPCALLSQNMLLLSLQLLDLFFSLFLAVLGLLAFHWDLYFHLSGVEGCHHMFTIYQATDLGKKARELKKAVDALHQEERGGNKGRKWRKTVKSVEKELLLLEEVKALEEMYPQGEKAETTWAMTVLGYHARVDLLIVSVAWVAHIVIYLLIDPPLSSFLNEVFVKLHEILGNLENSFRG